MRVPAAAGASVVSCISRTERPMRWRLSRESASSPLPAEKLAGGEAYHRQRGAQLVARIPGEVPLALDVRVHIPREPVERFGQGSHLFIGVRRQPPRCKCRCIRSHGVEAAHFPDQPEHWRHRAPREPVGEPCREIENHERTRERNEPEPQGEVAHALAVKDEKQRLSVPLGHVGHREVGRGIDVVEPPDAAPRSAPARRFGPIPAAR